MKIEHSAYPYDDRPNWRDETMHHFIMAHIDPPDDLGYGESAPGELEKMQRSIERTQEFTGKLVELLHAKGVFSADDILKLTGKPSHKYRITP